MKTAAAAVVFLLLAVPPPVARAHCDTLDGPVVKTARSALDAKDPRPVLAWVKPEHDAEIRTAFSVALEARKSRPSTRDASDRRFSETVVRVHRAGEGAPYTGLKPAGSGTSVGVRAADRAIETGDASGVERMLADAVRSGLHDRFATLSARRPPGEDVAAGRAWVEAYVEYVHHVERLEGAAQATASHGEGAEHHGPASATTPHGVGEHQGHPPPRG
jgi:hypothetical protein